MADENEDTRQGQDQDQEPPRRGNDRRPAQAKAGKQPKQPDPTKDKIAADRVPKPATNLTTHAKGTGYSGDEAVIEDLPEPPRVTLDGLRLDGPKFDKWVEDGNDPNEYPPPSYADRRIVNDDGLRTDGPTYEAWIGSGKLASEYPQPGFAARHEDEDAGEFMTDEQVNDARARGEWPGRGALRSRDRTTVEASRGAVDPPAPGVVRPIAAGGQMGAAASATGSISPFPSRDPATGLRTDGPSYDEYIAAGFDGRSYPPAGYTDKRQPAGSWPSSASGAATRGGQGDIGQGRRDQAAGGEAGNMAGQGTEAGQRDPAQASSVLPSGTEAVEYGRTETDEEQKARLENERVERERGA